MDADGNGTIDFEEFLGLVKNLKSDNEADDLKEAFKWVIHINNEFKEWNGLLCILHRVFDADGNGLIDREELKRVMASLNEELSEEDLSAMINEADTDKDGQISFEEFKAMMGAK